MAPPTFSDYLVKEGAQVKNLQTLLSYYGELYQFYSDKLPNNKYIDFLEENLFREGFSTMPPAVSKFVALRPDQMALLRPYVRFYKVFRFEDQSIKKVEIPFENKTDLFSFEDPQSYIGTPFPFVAQRFNGPIALLTGIGIREGGVNGRAATVKSVTWARVSLNVTLQDAKMLFKNWGTREFPVFYKDLFAAPVRDKSRGIKATFLKLELGYNVPDDADGDLKLISQNKICYDLFPVGVASRLSYEEDGSLNFSADLQAKFQVLRDDINILDQKYYKQVKKANNMLIVEDEDKVSIDKYQKKEDQLEDDKLISLEQGMKKQATTQVNKKKESKDSFSQRKQDNQEDRTTVQLASSVGATPTSFSFITALYEAGLIYYFEIDNDTYKDYIQKIAKKEPVDVSNISFLPQRRKKTRLDPIDTLRNNPDKSEYFANTLRIKKLNSDEEETSSFEKIKFFYFGDLVDIMLNSTKGTGVGQDLDEIGGEEEFSYLFGPIMWLKNTKTKIVYNILNTPISLDMFMFELNREIYQKRRKRIGLDEFFSVFMKKFFDVVVLSYEKNVSGKFNQQYVGNVSYVLDKDKYERGSKFKKKLFNFVPTVDTVETKSATLIAALPIENKLKSNSFKKRNIPTFYVGGPDKGPLKTIDFQLSVQDKKAEYEYARRMRNNVRTVESIDDPLESGFMTSYFTRASMTMTGNVFFRLADIIFIDSRFVDAGFFLKKENKVFFTGFYRIVNISHQFGSDGSWETSIDAIFAGDIESDDESYNSYSGELPDSQNVDISSEANLNRQVLVDSAAANSTADKKPDSKAKVGTAKANTNTSVNPVTVPKE